MYEDGVYVVLLGQSALNEHCDVFDVVLQVRGGGGGGGGEILVYNIAIAIEYLAVLVKSQSV